jgi:hypothetical protein
MSATRFSASDPLYGPFSYARDRRLISTVGPTSPGRLCFLNEYRRGLHEQSLHVHGSHSSSYDCFGGDAPGPVQCWPETVVVHNGSNILHALVTLV